MSEGPPREGDDPRQGGGESGPPPPQPPQGSGLPPHQPPPGDAVSPPGEPPSQPPPSSPPPSGGPPPGDPRAGPQWQWTESGWQQVPPAGWQQPPSVPPAGWQQQPSSPPTNGKATVALVMGILGLVVCPLVCSILALVFGYQARSEIDRSGEGGRGSAVAGIVLGWIGTVLSVLAIVFFVILAVASDEFWREFERELERQNYGVPPRLAAVLPAAAALGRALGA